MTSLQSFWSVFVEFAMIKSSIDFDGTFSDVSIKTNNHEVRRLKIPSNIGNLRTVESLSLCCSTNNGAVVVTERTGWTEVDPVSVLVYNYRVKTRWYEAFFMIRRHRLKWPILLKHRLDPLRFTVPAHSAVDLIVACRFLFSNVGSLASY